MQNFPYCALTHGLEISGFFVTQILRAINFGEFRSCKRAIFKILRDQNFVNLVNFNLPKVQKSSKSKFRTSKLVRMADFNTLE